jgi:D-beta-D-heptose 7-phosphate kinase/D-beta-D-heptose 1-phosphate adenosyltransferase
MNDWAVPGSPAHLAQIVRQFKGVQVLVVGDPMLDYYHFGHVDRLSPEAPVPVFIEDKIDLRDGGAANVAANLAALGCTVTTHFPPAPHSMKHRYLVGSQQLFRIDNDRDHSKQEMWRGFNVVPHAVVISDYGKGWCRPDRLRLVIDTAIADGVPVIVDPKGNDWTKYAGATVICPNEHEMIEHYAWMGHMLHKRGAKGMTLIYPDRTEEHFEAQARHVFDVTGAGDTVVAVMAAALAVRCELATAAMLANIAAGIVVGEVGTVACSSSVLIRELEQ